jgi:hypothetical protein
MAIYDDQWFEIWYSDGESYEPYYLLLVMPNPQNKGEIIVSDREKNNEIIFRSNNYEEVRNWLSEDEFELVEGRTFPDDGW